MRLVVLNRLGVLQPEDPPSDNKLAVFDDVPDALAKLSNAGFTLVVASNEPGIGHGELDLDELEAAHTKLNELVENRGGAIAAFFYCPHTPEDQCHCHKPKTGLIDAIELEFATPANEILLFSHSPLDLELADAIGCDIICVNSHISSVADSKPSVHCFDKLMAAVDFTLRNY